MLVFNTSLYEQRRKLYNDSPFSLGNKLAIGLSGGVILHNYLKNDNNKINNEPIHENNSVLKKMQRQTDKNNTRFLSFVHKIPIISAASILGINLMANKIMHDKIVKLHDHNDHHS